MTALFAALILVHGLIHLMGPAKAFGYADLPQLTIPIPPAMGLVWLLAALLLLAASVTLLAGWRWWWAIGAVGVLVSQVAIAGAWTDAKYGTILNLVVFVGAVFGFLAWGPTSLLAAYDHDVDQRLPVRALAPMVVESDLAHLPIPVQKYLRVAGVVGQPRMLNMRVHLRGRIRSGPNDAWMPFTAEQHNFFDQPARLFYMNASRMLIPVQVLHRFVGTEATMRVKLAALIPIAEASGAEMTRAETVTLFNDMCLFAPASLIDPAIGWEPVDDRTARATFSHAGYGVQAVLRFNEGGELVDFRSEDRRQASPDGASMRAIPWSTPIGHYREFGAYRLGSRGEGRWHEPAGAYNYIELDVEDIRFNVNAR